MTARFGRRKGVVAEREVAALVEAWWSALEPGCRFVRTPSSGGWSTPTVRADFKTGGDLMSTASRWPFSVEVKRREGWVLERLLRFLPSPAWGWWAQSCRAAFEDGRHPMLWARRSRSDWVVVLPVAFGVLFDALLAKGSVPGWGGKVVIVEASALLALSPGAVARLASRLRLG